MGRFTSSAYFTWPVTGNYFSPTQVFPAKPTWTGQNKKKMGKSGLLIKDLTLLWVNFKVGSNWTLRLTQLFLNTRNCLKKKQVFQHPTKFSLPQTQVTEKSVGISVAWKEVREKWRIKGFDYLEYQSTLLEFKSCGQIIFHISFITIASLKNNKIKLLLN